MQAFVCVCVFACYIILIRGTGSRPKRNLLRRPPAKYIRVRRTRTHRRHGRCACAANGSTGGKKSTTHLRKHRTDGAGSCVYTYSAEHLLLFGTANLSANFSRPSRCLTVAASRSPCTPPLAPPSSASPVTTSPTSLPWDATYRSRNVG